MIEDKSLQSEGDEELDILLRLLLSHNNELVTAALRKQQFRVRKSLREEDLRQRVIELLDSGDLTKSDVAEILNDLEGWGDQQIYLYSFNGNSRESEQWSNDNWLRSHFRGKPEESLLNATNPTIMPPQPELVSINRFEYRNDVFVRFVWVERRISLKRSADDDERAPKNTRTISLEDGQRTQFERIVFLAYRETTVRGIMTFDWNITRNEAHLAIYKATGSDYSQLRDDRLKELAMLGLPVENFEVLRVSRLISRIRESDEVIRWGLGYQTMNRGGSLVFSSGDQDDLFADQTLDHAYNSVSSEVAGIRGRLRWKLSDWKPHNRRDLGVEIYGRSDDQRVGIDAEATEDDIRYVLQRIRTYCT